MGTKKSFLAVNVILFLCLRSLFFFILFNATLADTGVKCAVL